MLTVSCKATANARDSIEYGTRVVGGVSPGKGGSQHLRLPVFDSVKKVCTVYTFTRTEESGRLLTVFKAMAGVRPDATAVFVPALKAGAAIEEAIAAEIPLIVSVAEHVPVHDMLRVQQILRTQTASRLVGPNCPGIIAPGGVCRIGIMPHRQYLPGRIGVVSKSGTLSYEAVGQTTAAGLGQSLVVGVGGDMLPGTTLVDGLKLFANHDGTDAIIMIGEIGGMSEFEAAAWIRDYHANTPPDQRKPIVAMVAGRTARQGKVMGHAGALLNPGDVSAEAKAIELQRAGATLVPHPGYFGAELKRLLNVEVSERASERAI